MSILSELNVSTALEAVEKVVSGALDYLKDLAISAAQKAVAIIKETSLGTAIMNLISAASQTDGSGSDKFAAVLAAAQKAYQAFVDNGGLKGIFDSVVSVLRQVIQSLFDDFASATK